jgi:hypothetical protein
MTSGAASLNPPERAECPDMKEREPRRAVSLDAFAHLPDGSMLRVIVVDLTYDGCKITTPVALLKGIKVKLAVLRLGSFDAEVRWYADEHAGLKFIGNEEASEPQRERQERLPVSAAVTLRRMGRAPYRARVFDFSPSGCKVEFVERPRVGEQLWVKVEGLDSIEAEVRWVDGFYGGVEFKRAIYPAVFELLLSRLQQS